LAVTEAFGEVFWTLIGFTFLFFPCRNKHLELSFCTSAHEPWFTPFYFT